MHKGDLTGIEIINRLMEQVLSRPSRKLQEHRAIGLIPTKDGSALAGVLMIDMRTGRFRLVRAKTVLMATGGGPTMYKYHTPSGDKTMDGLAMALRAGLPLRDMEMVQFHPTGLLAGDHTRMTGTVLEEGLRGAGGQLVNYSGQRFMFDYDAKGERATRDVVSRGIYAEMRKTNNPEQEGVFISMAHLGPDLVAEKFKGMVKRCADCGFDLAGGKVEVVPTAHYFMGGVVVDVDTRTAMEGLVRGRRGRGRRAWLEPSGWQRGGQLHRLWRHRGRCHGPRRSRLGPARSGPRGAGGRVGPRLPSVFSDAWARAAAAQAVAGGHVGRGGRHAHGNRAQEGVTRIATVSDALMDVGVAADNLAFNLTWHDWLNLRLAL